MSGDYLCAVLPETWFFLIVCSHNQMISTENMVSPSCSSEAVVWWSAAAKFCLYFCNINGGSNSKTWKYFFLMLDDIYFT